MFRIHRTKLAITAKVKPSILPSPRIGCFSTTSHRLAASKEQELLDESKPKDQTNEKQHNKSESTVKTKPATKKLTVAEQDELLRKKMAGIEGDGGASGVEYENGQPVAMKRSVKNNMFRYI